MKKELRFFMDSIDEDSFFKCFESIGGEIIKDSEYHWFLCFGKQKIQLLRCERIDTSIILGRLSIFTQEKDADSKNTESVFRKLEKHIKNFYVNDVYCWNEKKDNSKSLVKNVWFGSSITNNCIPNGIKLKQSNKGSVYFGLIK